METDDADRKNSSKANRIAGSTSDEEQTQVYSALNRYKEVRPKDYLPLKDRRGTTAIVYKKLAASQTNQNKHASLRGLVANMETRTVKKPREPCVSLPGKLVPSGIHVQEKTSQNIAVNKDYLAEIVKHSPEEVVKEFQRHQDGFIRIMKTCGKDGSMVDNLFLVLAKVIGAISHDQFLQLSIVLRESLFLENVAVPHLLSLVGSACQNISIVRSAVSLVNYVANYSVSSVVSFYSILTALSDLIKEVRSSDFCSPDIAREFDVFDDIKSEIHKLRRSQQKKKKSTEDGMLPPEDYRSIVIVPTSKELLSCDSPFLRKNKEFGSYNDLGHYLDVQFRLLREDFVAPLRESITAYKAYMQGIGSEKKTVKDVRIYSEVEIAGTSTSNDGLGHILTFDTSRYKDELWEQNKRLIYGSLLCLSYDDFKTIYMAVVINRDVEDLKLGIIEVQFTCEWDTVRTIANQMFVMVESDAYFEAYRYNLIALQLITDLPFSRYIVDCAEDTNAPAYLRKSESMRYDLQLLATRDAVEKRSDETGGYDKEPGDTDFNHRTYKQKENKYPELQHVQVLTDSAWPCKSSLGLDDSQYRALKNALIHEFSITQGPPGTGKTYIGLKIARALLANKKVWSFSARKQQLLVVCHTNHALDQFLCGIQDFYRGIIVRVGGRSSNNKMQQCSIKTLYKHASDDILEESKALHTLAEKTEKRINELKNQIYFCDRKVLNAGELTNQIGRFQVSLEDGFHRILEHRSKDRDEDDSLPEVHQDLIQEWLGLDCIPCQADMQVHFENIDTEMNSSAFRTFCRTELKSVLPAEDLTRYYVYTGCRSKETVRSIQENRRKKSSSKIHRTSYLPYKEICPMTEEAQEKVSDVWSLTFKQRWELYKSWVERLKYALIEIMQEYEENYERVCLEIKQATQEKQREALQKADVIGMTTTGAAKYYEVLQHIKPKIVIVEEAAEVLEGHIVTSLSEDCEQLILIGDHKQLRPSPTVYQLAKRYNLDISLFERMINNKVKYECLEYQHRMRPEISQIIRLFYPNLKDHDSVRTKPDIRGISSNVFFIAHSYPEDKYEDITSHSNEYEAQFLVALCRYLLKQEYEPSQITVLTTYSAQMFKLRKLMPKDSEFGGITITVVDNYQGEENEIILLSLVRSNSSNRVGFIKTENRVNVALSRARNGLFVIGNFEAFAEAAEIWKAIVQLLRKDNRIGSSLPLFCRNHNDRKHFATNADDFDKAPEGGCQEDCDTRLECGHVCGLKCHVYDTEHKAYKCAKKCTRLCKNNHPCSRLCFEKCDDCQIPIVKTIPECGHAHTMPCFREPIEWQCRAVCERTCPTNHKCNKLCFEYCGDCKVEITKKMPKCGHVQLMPCFMKPVNWKCQEPCEDILGCGHKCMSKCSGNHLCEVPVVKSLPKCGHEQTMPCHKDPENWKCNAGCEKMCRNGHKCNKLCFEKCGYCIVEVTKEMPKCGHKQLMPCYMESLKWKCQEPCEDILGCGHKCMSKCSGNHICEIQVVKSLPKCGHEQTMPCHKDPENWKCNAGCKKMCRNGHKCNKLCFEHCGNCEIQMTKEMPKCGHMQTIPCYVEPLVWKCKFEMTKEMSKCGHLQKMPCYVKTAMWKCLVPCEDILECGHKCRSKCSGSHKCRIAVMINLEKCGHVAEVKCYKRTENIYCKEPCEFILKCGHKCLRKCYEEHTSICLEKVAKVLACGHSIVENCYKNSLTRNVRCIEACKLELACGHKCKKRCSDPHTIACKERVDKELPCCLRKLRVLCSDVITKINCPFPCKETLECGHPCKNKCSEPHTAFCEVLTDRILTCKHSAEVFCGTNEIDVRCMEPCEISLACGHRCMKRCCDPHTVACKHLVDKELPCCNRKLVVFCSEDIANIKCPFPCEETLECGHRCRNKCSESHTVFCQELVEKVLICTHIREIFCGIKRDDRKCFFPCRTKLDCGHNCKNLCWQPHTDNCCVQVNYVCHYGHETLRPCHTVFNKTEINCYFKCRRNLECGHICRGSCSECSGGILHMKCFYCPLPDQKDHLESLSEELYESVARNRHGNKEQKRMELGVYVRHRHIHKCLDTLHVQLREMNPGTDLYRIYKDRLERIQKKIIDCLHFQTQGYSDIKKELDRLLRVADTMLANERVPTAERQEIEGKSGVRELENEMVESGEHRDRNKYRNVKYRRTKQRQTSGNVKRTEQQQQQLRKSGENKETSVSGRQQVSERGKRGCRSKTLIGRKDEKQIGGKLKTSVANGLMKGKENERVGGREKEIERRVCADRKKKEKRVCKRKVIECAPCNVGQWEKDDLRDNESKTRKPIERDGEKCEENRESEMLVNREETVGKDTPAKDVCAVQEK